MIRYKLSNQDRTTHNGFKLPAGGEWFYPKDMLSPPRECSNTVLHHYAHPLLAVLFNPIHAGYKNPLCFEIEIEEEIGTDGLKGWCRGQRIIEEISLPILTTEQRIAFSIYCAEPYEDENWQIWAKNWMSGADRSAKAAWAAEAAAWAAEAAAEAAWAAAWAAEAAAWAAWAARAAAWAAEARAAAEAAWAAEAAAEAAWAAEAAAWAAEARARKLDTDFLLIIEKVLKLENTNAT